MTLNLNLALNRLLTQEETAKAPMALSPFGNLGRYLFLVALEIYCDSKSLETKDINKYLDLAWQSLDKAALKKMKCPLANQPRQLDTDSVNAVYASKLRAWYRDTIKESRNYTLDEKNLFTKAMSFLSKGEDITPSGLKTMESIAYSISPQMGTLFNNTVNNADKVKPREIKKLFSELKETVRALTGKANLKITDPKISERAQRNKSIASLLDSYKKELKAIRDAFNIVFKKEVARGPVDAETLETKLTNMGFEILFFPSKKNGFKGLVGLVDGKLALFTPKGQQLHGGVHPDAKITLNKNYDPETQDGYYLSYVAPNAATATRVYTIGFRNKADEQKHLHTEVNLGNTDKWITAWRRDLKSNDLMRKVPAVIAYILYMTGARVGSSTESRSATGKAATYGISTLRASQVKVDGTKIDIKYIGKKSMPQHHVLTIADDPYYKICAKVLQDLKKDKSPKDLLFAFPRPTSVTGQVQVITYSFFAKYMKSVGVQKIHSMRHIRGTKLTTELLNSVPFKATGSTLKQKQASADKYMKEKILTKVGDLLGHKATNKSGETKTVWSTSVKSYVNPTVIKDWYLKQHLDIPSWLPKKIES